MEYVRVGREVFPWANSYYSSFPSKYLPKAEAQQAATLKEAGSFASWHLLAIGVLLNYLRKGIARRLIHQVEHRVGI